MTEFEYQEFDREIWEEELEAFVPPVVYDMHAHIWSEAHKGSAQGAPTGLRTEFDYAAHVAWARDLYPGRQLHYLMLGTPIPGLDATGHNAWMAEQMAADPDSEVHMLVTPDMTPEYVAARIRTHGFIGLKPYRFFAPDPAECRIRDFLPESLIEVADDLGLSVTLHLSRKAGIADPRNQEDLALYTRRYPRVQWILAHCARAFNAFMLEEAVHFLKDLPNLWYDTSAVNDLYSHYLLMKHEDRRRVMFGTDNIVAGCARGKYIAYARAWQFLPGMGALSHCDPRPTLVVYEQLRQQKRVAQILGLTPQEIEDLFSGNARRLILHDNDN